MCIWVIFIHSYIQSHFVTRLLSNLKFPYKNTLTFMKSESQQSHANPRKNGENKTQTRVPNKFSEKSVQILLKAGLGLVWKERAYSVESSLQSISSNSFLWKRTNCSVATQTWSWRGKPAASARAWLREANAKRFHLIFHTNSLNVPNVEM